jgi:signal transduction histidine kinase
MSDDATDVMEVRALIRVSFLLRMLTLLASLSGYVDRTLSPLAIVAIILLTATSMAGIAIPEVPDFLQRHPFLIVVDGLLMTGLMVTLGTDNPLVLVALSSCVITGVVLAPIPAALSTFAMVGGYLAASLRDDELERSFLAAYGFPVTFVLVVVLGQVFRVLAERKRQSERAFADLVSGAAAAQERARLARELHDSTAKTLQGLVLTARSLEHWIERDPRRAAAEASDIAESASDAVVRLRELLSTLRQDNLDQPFHESLAALARDCTHGHDVRLRLELDQVTVSAPSVRYELLAAAREAILNALTHSGTDRLVVRLHSSGDDLTIEVVDSGCGFSLDVLADREREGHFGVRGYTERLEQVGGRADIESHLGRGTCVRLVAPLMGLKEASYA